MSEFIWLFCLMVTHVVAYYLGRGDGEKCEPSERAWLAAEMYDIDKHYEHQRWLEERKENHG